MNRRILIIFIFCFLLSAFGLSAQNTMQQIAYLEGEMEQSWFGNTMAALDFNGDGYDDLVVSSPCWVDWNQNISGRLYFFIGGEVFDDEADFTLTADVMTSMLGSYLTNIGDINGDGMEDLGYSCQDADSLYLNILLGNAEQDTIPDFVMSRYEYDYYASSIRTLGDIDNDGFDDVGIIWRRHSILDPDMLLEFYIILGGPEINEPELLFVKGNSIYGFSGVGDVNNDGFDDFCVGYCDVDDEYYTNNLYFGNTVIDTTNYVCLWQAPSTNMTLGLPAGDLNNDGYADFCGHFSWDVDVWLGGNNITQNFDLSLEYGSGGGGEDFGYDYGDLNNDGFSDMVLGSPNWGLNGAAFLYLGNETPNNTVDIEFEEPPGVHHRFGKAVAIGRFDGDEYEDLAIAGPEEESTGPNPGYVYVLAGNGELEDLVGVDEHEIPVANDVIFNAYPNPFNPTVTFTVKYSNEQNQQYEQIQIEIYNVKGQIVERIDAFPNRSLGTSNVGRSETITWNAENQASGIYFCKLVNVGTGKILSVKKVTLLK
ncbi:MAG: T9SS type A sorting domain-containing protein [Candidatus Cloacimonadales bacterium]|nr:T9SS type A sorting domain-containing protein [Candidatus Cloacimonadales bacterium]